MKIEAGHASFLRRSSTFRKTQGIDSGNSQLPVYLKTDWCLAWLLTPTQTGSLHQLQSQNQLFHLTYLFILQCSSHCFLHSTFNLLLPQAVRLSCDQSFGQIQLTAWQDGCQLLPCHCVEVYTARCRWDQCTVQVDPILAPKTVTFTESFISKIFHDIDSTVGCAYIPEQHVSSSTLASAPDCSNRDRCSGSTVTLAMKDMIPCTSSLIFATNM